MSQPPFIVHCFLGDRELFVAKADDDSGAFFTVFDDSDGIRRRFDRDDLPRRRNRLDAEVDLLRLARNSGWPVEWIAHDPVVMAEASEGNYPGYLGDH